MATKLKIKTGDSASLPESTSTESPVLILSFVAMVLENLGCERDDLHEIALAQLACNGPEDARAPRVALVVDDHRRVLVERDVRAVVTVMLLRRAHHDGRHHLALLDGPVGRGLLDGADDDIPDTGIATPAAALDADAEQLAGAGVVGDTQPGLDLDHFATSTISATRQRLVRDSGRVSTRRTTSPTFELLASSWACSLIERRSILWYFGCGLTTSTRTTTVLSIASETTTPRRSLRRPRVCSAAVTRRSRCARPRRPSSAAGR